MTDGTQFETQSTYSGGTMRLEIDPKSHQAWTGVHRLDSTAGQLAKFNSRFKNFVK
jgi:large subunit ribosomal protein L31